MNKLKEKINKLMNMNKSNYILTQWTMNDINYRLSMSTSDINRELNHDSELLAYLYQGAGLKINENLKEDSKKLYIKSYNMWKVIWYSSENKKNKDYIKQLFYLVSMGILSDSIAEIRMILKEIDLKEHYYSLSKESWPNYLENSIYIILMILVRKDGGWDDIHLVNSIVINIQLIQKEIEEKYLEDVEVQDLYDVISWIGALLNVLEAIEQYKKYVLTGKPDNIEKIIIRHCNDSYELLQKTVKEENIFTFRLIEKMLIKLVSISIWANMSGISDKLDEYVELLTLESNKKPIFELWPSQQMAISMNLFDNTKTSVVVQMPTSAGKTLLSKFYIMQTFSLYSNAKIAYIVPTRALVNQVKRDLKKDFSRLGINVEVSIPYSDIEDMEEELLLKNSDIIVTTPEKLDILMRVKHPIIDKLKLVVVDEAHGIHEGSRGAKLELLMAMLRKDNRTLRILMLSPFIKNAESISNWLGGNRGHNVYVDWKPSQQFTGIYQLEQVSRGNHKGEVTYIPSSLNTMYTSEFKVFINNSNRKNISKVNKAIKVADVYSKIGGVLVLCTTKATAEKVASGFLYRDELGNDKLDKLEILLSLVESEMGADSLLYSCIRRGCAYHHSSIPLIIREEIEDAISKQLIKIVSATTTLAQGMNFPISTVIFQGMNMPNGNFSRPMTPSEFWNIAGRAGRALVDKEGHIISICDNESDEIKFRNYLTDKNQEVLSSLFEVLERVPVDGINSYWIKECQELSALLQYIYHIILVDPNIDVEDLLRGSLVYHQLDEFGDRSNAEKLIKMTKNYISKLNPDKERKKLMESIDKTGLSSVSMHKLISKLSKANLILDDKCIFSDRDSSLAKIIEVINDIPEINLGLFNKSGFEPELVANITKDWVNGKTIKQIAEDNIFNDEKVKTLDDKVKLCGQYIYSTLINNVPWGISAVQRANGIINKVDDSHDRLIPSYIYFGVKSKAAVAFSMLGVPRFVAQELGEYWSKNKGNIDIDNLNYMRNWLENLSKEEWIRCFKDKKKAIISYDLLQKNISK